jgi:DNA-binding MarR family transcriptional regulator
LQGEGIRIPTFRNFLLSATLLALKHGSPYNSDAKQVLDAFRRIVQALRLSDRAAERRAGVSGAQLFVLEKLAAAKGSLSVNELADATLTHQSSVSVVVQKLEKQQLITRSRSGRDSRRVELSLTSKARRLLAKAAPAAQQRIVEAVAALPAAQRKQLSQLLGSLAREVAGEAPAVPAMFFEDAKGKRRRG